MFVAEHENSTNAKGFLAYSELLFNYSRYWSGQLRLLYFETDNYDSRVYTFESDVPYHFSIPAFYGKGFRYYINFNVTAGKHVSCWLRWTQTIYLKSIQMTDINDNQFMHADYTFQIRYSL
jgi:hypothetical protein